MTKKILLAAIAIVAVASADERPTLRDGATPRAADLLQAQKLANRAASRLRTPTPRAEWKHAGAWDTPRAATPAQPPSVRIDLGGARRRAPQP